ncbi:ATP-binding protein [Brevundimonas sp. 2R-24]|uniref:histidine kinase n=1 Tax=Peiella sedimenti TaxID=3061083 RepID=A0ABT8SPG9_9CAUL|nr:ATP-binding protein [Caulobacteraceae bacterium XZ-24]
MRSTTMPTSAAAPRRPASAAGFTTDPRMLAAPMLLGAVVCLMVIAALATSRSAGLVAALWLAGGTAAGGWMLAPRRPAANICYGAMLGAAFLTGNLLAGNPAPLAFMFTCANMLEVTAAVFLVRRFAPRMRVQTVKGLGRFLLASAVIAPALGAGVAAVILSNLGRGELWPMFQTWWLGHALSFAVVPPFMIAGSRYLKAGLQWRVMAQHLLALGLVGAVATLVFTNEKAPGSFLILPLMILVASRARVAGAAAALVLVAAISILLTRAGQGPLHVYGLSLLTTVQLAQLFVLTGCLPALWVAALLEERDELARQARAGQLRAERASDSKSRLLANVAHEIKSPIAGVIGIGELWGSGKLGLVSAEQKDMSEMLVRTARQIENFAKDLLDVAHAEAGTVRVNLKPVDVGALIEDVRGAVALTPEARGLQWIVPPMDEAVTVMADSVRLHQVLANLASNAVKYGASGGEVRFAIERPAVDVVRIIVADRGPGLSPEKQALLYEPFNRLGMERSKVEGHGIGLALARRLTELQNGRIGVDSAEGQGCAFWVELPAA